MLLQAGMTQGGIEATRRADYLWLPGVNHALQHFARVFLSLEFAFLTHDFTHLCQGFGHGRK